LVDHPWGDLDAEYLMVPVEHAAGSMATVSLPGEHYVNRFECRTRRTVRECAWCRAR